MHVSQPVGEGSRVAVFMAEGAVGIVEGVLSTLDMLIQDQKPQGEELRFPLVLVQLQGEVRWRQQYPRVDLPELINPTLLLWGQFTSPTVEKSL